MADQDAWGQAATELGTSQSPASSSPSADAWGQAAAEMGGQQQQQTAQQQPDTGLRGFASGLYDNTLGGLVSAVKVAAQPATEAISSLGEAGSYLANGEYLKAAGSLLSSLRGADGSDTALKLVHGLVQAHVKQGEAAIANAKAGQYSEAAGHGLAAVTPVVGPAAAEAGETIGRGEVAKGLGEAAGLIGSVVAAPALGKLAEAAPEAVSAVRSGAGPAVRGVVNIAKDIPAGVESNLVDALGDFAEKQGLDRPAATTAREVTANIGGQFKQRAQAAYATLDEEAPGFQELRDTIGKQKNALRVQENLDPVKADAIRGELKTLQSRMDDLLDTDQQQRWADANSDYSRFKAIQQFGRKVTAAGEDLTSDNLTNVPKLQTGMQQLSNSARRGNPVDLLQKAFGDDATTLKQVVQKGVTGLNERFAGKALLKWLGRGAVAGTGLEVIHALGGK